MNSTNSHQMRNPLNLLESLIQKQTSQLVDLSSLVSENPEACTQIEKIEHSLQLAKSSIKLITFSVEDVLALPQLKSGKFVKNIENIDIR